METCQKPSFSTLSRDGEHQRKELQGKFPQVIGIISQLPGFAKSLNEGHFLTSTNLCHAVAPLKQVVVRAKGKSNVEVKDTLKHP